MSSDSNANFRRLRAALGEFSRLTGRPVRSKLVEETLSEGEYKDSMSPELGSHGQTDDLSIPDFLKRKHTEQSQKQVDDLLGKAEAARKKGKGKPTKTEESVMTKAQVIEAINRIQDAGYVRGRTQFGKTQNHYQFFHHGKPTLNVVVERANSGYRMTGVKLDEFDVAPGGPMPMKTLAMGQAEGEDMGDHPLSERVLNALHEAFDQADYSVQLYADPRNKTGGVTIRAVPQIGKMPRYEFEELSDMILGVITRMMREQFPDLQPFNRPGVTGWNTGGANPYLVLIYEPKVG